MKKLIIGGCTLFALAAQAQKTPVKKPAVPAKTTFMKSFDDSTSYAIGLLVANFYQQQGIKKLNIAMINKAINDVYGNKPVAMNEEQANFVIMKRLNTNPRLIENIEEGERFLAKNGKRSGVTTTGSGLQYEVIVQGKGQKPASADTVTVNYKGTLLNGTVFDQNNGLSFPLGNVIAGWTEGLQLMPLGSKYKLFIPYKLGYGMNDMGAIPAGATLVFEVELVDIKKAAQQ